VKEEKEKRKKRESIQTLSPSFPKQCGANAPNVALPPHNAAFPPLLSKKKEKGKNTPLQEDKIRDIVRLTQLRKPRCVNNESSGITNLLAQPTVTKEETSKLVYQPPLFVPFLYNSPSFTRRDGLLSLASSTRNWAKRNSTKHWLFFPSPLVQHP